jgi:hypothetical protein
MSVQPPTIAGPGIAENGGAEVHAQLDRRVSNMESWAGTLQKSIDRVEEEARQGQARLESKLDQQTQLIMAKIESISTRQLAGQRTNWGVLASWVGVGVVLVSAVGIAYTRPLEASTASHERLLSVLDERERVNHDRAIRNEERTAALREKLGLPATPAGVTP